MRNSKNILSVIIILLIALLAVAAYGVRNYSAIDLSMLDKNNREKIELIVKEYIVNNPEVLLDSMANLRVKKESSVMHNMQSDLREKRNIIEQVNNNPAYGAQDSDITIVEFYDYRCSHCKKSSNVLARLISDDQKIKVIYKEFPILGENSFKLSRIALAVHLTDPTKFVLFHNKLMEVADPSEESAKNILKELNISYEQVINKSKDNLITEILEENRELARSIGVGGTPTFIINGELVNDPYEINQLRNLIEKIRHPK